MTWLESNTRLWGITDTYGGVPWRLKGNGRI